MSKSSSTPESAQPTADPDHGVVEGVDPDGGAFSWQLPRDADVLEVEEKVRAAGGRVVRIRRPRVTRETPRGVSAQDFARFNDLLANALQHRIPMADGLRQIAKGLRRGRFRGAVEEAARRLDRGLPLAGAFAEAETGFPPFYGSLLEAGAAAGRVPEVLLGLNTNIRSRAEFRRGILETGVYPVFLLCACIMAFIGFAFAVWPECRRIASGLPMVLPEWMQWLTLQSAASRLVFGAVSLGLVGLLVGALRRIGRGACGPEWLDAAIMRVPLLGRIYEADLWSGVADALALTLRAGVPMPSALRTAAASASPMARRLLEWLAGHTGQGVRLSEAVWSERAVPVGVARAAETGEIQGDVPGALALYADTCRRSGEWQARMFLRHLAPALGLLMGLVVGCVAFILFSTITVFWEAPW